MVPIELAEACADHKGWLFVYIWLWHYAGRDDQAFPSVQRLALECRMDYKEVRRALAWLSDGGWVQRIDRPGRTTLYHVRTEKAEPKRRRRNGSERTPGLNDLGVKQPLGQTTHPWVDQPLGQMPPPNKKDINPRTKTKNQLPNPPSLREGPPFPPSALGGGVAEEPAVVEHAPPVAAPHRQETTNTIATCNPELHPSPVMPVSPEKAPEQADGC